MPSRARARAVAVLALHRTAAPAARSDRCEAPEGLSRRSDAARIAIVDDDDQARRLAARLCAGQGYQVLQYAGGNDFLGAGPPDGLTCVVLDISTSGGTGIEVLRLLAARSSAPPVIVLTGSADIGLVVEAMKLRAIDLIEKPYQSEALLGAIERACIMTRETSLDRQIRREAAELVDRLTRRQQQVLHGIARGEPNKIIAWNLGLSVRTVESYRAQVLARLRARNTADAVRIAIAAGIIGGALYMIGNR